MEMLDAHGARLQVEMFDRAEPPNPARLEEFAGRATKLFAMRAA
jgi:hypothetical protein